MKVVILLMLSALFLGCSTEGEIKLINATSHYVYVEFESNNYVIEGSEDIPEYLILPVDTGKRFLFWSGDDEKVEIALEGETFAMYDFGEEVSTTEMVVKPNEASIAYLNPTNACVKIINDSGQEISDFGYYMDGGNFSPIITDNNIAVGDSLYYRLIPSTQEDVITYRFEYRFEGAGDMISTGEINTLYVDEVFIIPVQ